MPSWQMKNLQKVVKGKISRFTIFILFCNGMVDYMLLFNPIFLILLLKNFCAKVGRS